MPNVLVVDDSAVDRRLIGGILETDGDLKIEYAVDGRDALAKMEQSLPRLVVTDLVMPEMDGLELVAAASSRYPLVPVIVVTGKGNDQIAVQALQQGAASYVPKRTLAQDLLDTVRNVLAASGRRRGHTRLLGSMRRSNYEFVLENDCTLFSPLVAYLQEGVAQMGLCTQADCLRVGIALEEALANALYRGNLEVDSELREADDKAYHALVTRRCREAPYQDRRIHVEVSLSPEEAIFVIRDEGPGFDPATLPDPRDPANLERPSGRGVLLMRTFMDEVAYNEAGNEIRLTKRCRRRAPT